MSKKINKSIALSTQGSRLDEKVARGIFLDIEYTIANCNLDDLDKRIDEKIKEPISGYTFNGKIEIKKASDSYVVTIGYDPI